MIISTRREIEKMFPGCVFRKKIRKREISIFVRVKPGNTQFFDWKSYQLI